jgi:choline dehydrogenase-like flavoprotein
VPILDSAAFAGSDSLPDALRCDVCIIGSGPAGLTIARELSNTPLRVTILESGRAERQAETDALNEIESVGWPRATDQWLVRNRVVGGSSNTWGGRCAPFNEVDLEFRDWIPYSGWPFKIDDLTPYLDRSAKYLGLGAGSGYNDDRVWAITGRRKPKSDLDSDDLLPMFWQFSRDPDNWYDFMRFGRRLDADLGPNVTLVTNATVLRVNANESGRAVESVEFAAIGGRRWLLPATTIVVCAGGVENARLLLASDNVAVRGLGNQNDLVGRFLMDHLRGPVARFQMNHGRSALNRFGIFKSRAAGAHLYQHGMRLSPAVQRSEQLLNCAIWIGEFDTAPDDPWDALGRLLRRDGNVGQNLTPMVMNVGLLFRGLKNYFISHRGLPRKLNSITLEAMCEQRPNPDSRLTLSDRRDPFGMRIPRIDWRVSEDEARAMHRTAELMGEHLSRMGLAPAVLEDWVRDGAMIPQTFRDVAHPTGTTRMADDPANGVVDAQCQVHGVHGLFMGGSSVFPTSGHANSTQMVVTLALRLADTLQARASYGTVTAGNSGSSMQDSSL